ncbi:MAG: TlyA family rRNA (cytidine-2'-O)-methyltransferase, partial [Proteobacteria bacterium]
VLLERGATRVTAIDVGTNQLDWKMRNDERVKVLEKTNARHMKFEDLGQVFDVVVIDVSFISLDKILPTAYLFLNPEGGSLVTLIKPQFEVGPERVGKGGIVTDETARTQAVERIRTFGEGIGLSFLQLIDSPITGTDGNVEYLAHWKIRST